MEQGPVVVLDHKTGHLGRRGVGMSISKGWEEESDMVWDKVPVLEKMKEQGVFLGEKSE